jgi:peroxidase
MARCSTVSPRLYNFGGQNGSSDPTLDANYTATLRGQCKPGDAAAMVNLDPDTPTTFDISYYKLVASKRGLLSTDAALLLNQDTGAYVSTQANATSDDQFFADFAESFIAMSKIGALSHHRGQIRKVCSKVNPQEETEGAKNVAAAAARTNNIGAFLLAAVVAAPLVLLYGL